MRKRSPIDWCEAVAQLLKGLCFAALALACLAAINLLFLDDRSAWGMIVVSALAAIGLGVISSILSAIAVERTERRGYEHRT